MVHAEGSASATLCRVAAERYWMPAECCPASMLAHSTDMYQINRIRLHSAIATPNTFAADSSANTV